MYIQIYLWAKSFIIKISLGTFPGYAPLQVNPLDLYIKTKLKTIKI